MGHKQPFFSIIIPTYNRPRQLSACLQSLTCLDYPRDRFEVIIVDDGSRVTPEAVVAPFFDSIDVTLLTIEHVGLAAARNTGCNQAKGEFLAFTDDDCAPGSNWVQTLAARFNQVPEQAIGGRTINALLGNPYSTASQIVVDYLCRNYNADPNRAQFSTGNNLAIPAHYFHTIGGFTIDFALGAGEDWEFCDNLLSHGYRLIYAPEVIVYHYHALTLSSFTRQHFYYGRGSFQYHQARARRGHKRVKLEPFSFYLNLLRYRFWNPDGRRALLLFVLLVISQASTGMGFLVERMIRSK